MKNHIANPGSVQLLLPFHFFATILLDFARSKTNLVSSYRKTKIFIPFYFFARRHPKAIQQFYVWGEKPIFLHRCASFVIWQSCGNSSPMILQRNSIAMTSQGSFNLQLNCYNTEVSLQHWCKLLCIASFRWWAFHTILPVLAHLLSLFFHLITPATQPHGAYTGTLLLFLCTATA